MPSLTITERSIEGSNTVIDEPLLDRIYRARGIKSPQELERSIKSLPGFDLLKDAEVAADILADAIEANQTILIVGDFDTDGATSTAVAIRTLKAMGAENVHYCVPNRFKYGYGLSPAIIDEALDCKPDVLVTVDNGISSVEGVEHAKSLGMKVIVTDHHQPPAELPKADALVNPKRKDCDFPSQNLAGVGVIFYVMLALRHTLRERGWFDRAQLDEPNMAQFLDIVAVGTVADMVPLDHLNRTLVYYGLRRIHNGQACSGIYALLAAGGRNPRHCQASDLAFTVAPRLNAAGRLEDMSKGIACLTVDSPQRADAIAHSLGELNAERRELETEMQAEAEACVQALTLEADPAPALCLFNESWHQGIIGLLASRIKNRYHRPVVVFTEVEGNKLKGSARSIAGVHIHDVLERIASSHPSLLNNFGGHSMAAGLTIDKANYEAFQLAFTETITSVCPPHLLSPTVETDGVLPISYYNIQTVKLLNSAGPWGQGFAEPTFHGDFIIMEQRIVGQKHIKFVLSPVDHYGFSVDAIHFNTDLNKWPNEDCGVARVIYTLSLNDFRGSPRLQLMIQHIENADSEHAAGALQRRMDAIDHEDI